MSISLSNSFKNLLTPVCIFSFALVAGCKKFIEVKMPTDQITSMAVFTDSATATAAITGTYTEMMKTDQQFSSGFTTFYAGMAADELLYYSPGPNEEFSINNITTVNHGLLSASFWQPAYRYIYSANLAIENLDRSTTISQKVRAQLTGEAKFVRAFCYFHLVNLFGDVPLITTSDYLKSAALPRTAAADIYKQIIKDLNEAMLALVEAYPTAEKIRPNKWSAAALLARMYLYNEDWKNAEALSGAIISSGKYSLESNLNNVFLTSSNEAIWQLRPVNPSRDTWEGYQMVPSTDNTVPTFLLRDNLLSAFEPGDNRKTAWVASRIFSGQQINYPFKYKIFDGTNGFIEYYSVLRLAEQYLIRAESRIQQGNFAGAATDINTIRSRAGLNDISIASKDEGIQAVLHERQLELFAEWGHRWFDLKRTHKADAVLRVLKPATWAATDQLWPVPVDQLKANNALTQNAGY